MNSDPTTPKPPITVGFAGPKGVGKSTTATLLRHFTRGKWVDVHMLDGPYTAVSHMLGLPREMMESSFHKDVLFTERTAPIACLHGKTSRDVINLMAKAFREEFGDEFFIQLWSKDVATFHSHREVVTNSSVRFPFEVPHLDVVVELVREGVNYDSDPNGDPYNQPLPSECIDETLSLNAYGMSQYELAHWIHTKIKTVLHRKGFATGEEDL